jgi:stage IV sporulation protein FB
LTELHIRGIRLRIHLLFWAVIGLALMTGHFLEILTLFTIVIIHEMGHVAVARELGWTVTEIQLLPFGGVATMEDAAASHPMDEIVVALAGPFMNVVMMAVSLLFWWTNLWSEEWTRFFVNSNAIIAGFNLLPIWPLDGGRIVQAMLCYRLPYRQAALLSLGGSSVLAALMLGLSSLSFQPNEFMVALYLLIANVQAFLRFPYQFIRFLMDKYVRDPDHSKLLPVWLSPEITAMEAIQQLRRGCTHLFYVKDVGLLSEEQLLHALLVEHKHHVAVSQLV